MNRGGNDRYRDAAARSVDAQYERAPRCPGCGQVKGSGLGDHIVGCAELTKRPATPEPWEALARERKATRLVDVIERLCPMSADEAEQLDEGGRRAAAHLARVRPASEATWLLVVSRLREHEALSRRREAG